LESVRVSTIGRSITYGSFDKEVVDQDLRGHITDKAQQNSTFTDLGGTVDSESMNDNARCENECGGIGIDDEDYY
jgi:hypothetical protein